MDKPDRSENAVRRNVAAFYRACHVAEPEILFIEGDADYAGICAAFETDLNSVPVIAFALSLFGLVPAFLVSAVLSLINKGFGSEPMGSVGPKALVAGLMGAGFIVWIFAGDILKKWRIRKNSALPLRSKVRKWGSDKTPDGIIGSLLSAITASGGGSVFPPNGNTPSIVNASLRLGRERTLPPSERANVRAIRNSINETEGQDRGTLPLVVRHAVDLSMSVRELLAMDGLVIVRPFPAAGASTGKEAWKPDGLEPGLLRRSEMLIGKDRKDLRKLVLAAAAWPITEREAVYRAAGIRNVIDILGVAPSAHDEAGVLYRIGSGSSVICFVKVVDPVKDGEGCNLIHWISVPQHIVTAHEGVAWSFSLTDEEYRPTAEA